MRDRAWALMWWAMMAALAGCYSAHGTEGDAARDGGEPSHSDAGRDGGGPPDPDACPPVAGYLRCGPGCGDNWCQATDGTHCAENWWDPRHREPALDLCIPLIVPRDDPRSFEQSCSFDLDDRFAEMFCFSGGACVWAPGSRGRDDIWGGRCVRDELCEALPGHRPELRCMWSDLSEWVTGPPPAEVCPEADSRSPFCGGPCGDCPWPGGAFDRADAVSTVHASVMCVGRSDRRAIGACVLTLDNDPLFLRSFERRCSPTQSANELCLNHHDEALRELAMQDHRLFGGDPCACMVLEDPAHPGTFFEWGFAALADSCARYRDLYPGQVQCFDDDWTPLP